MLAESGSDVAVIGTLAGAVVSLVGVGVWAVRFILQKLLGRDGEGGAWGRFLSEFREMSTCLKKNTSELTALREDVKQNTTAVASLERTVANGNGSTARESA